MTTGSANLRIRYLGGGYDFPEFFADQEICILSEGLPLAIECHFAATTFVEWKIPAGIAVGLSSSAARHLSFIRVSYPDADFRSQIEAAIQLDALQAGGWQDTIAAAYEGLIKIVLHKDNWRVYPLAASGLQQFRKLYWIPIEITATTKILTAMRCRESSFDRMQALALAGEQALVAGDIAAFGKAVREAWQIKTQWHPDISNRVICEMEHAAEKAKAWGWKVCGADGQGYFLVIGDDACHQTFRKTYEEFEVDRG